MSKVKNIKKKKEEADSNIVVKNSVLYNKAFAEGFTVLMESRTIQAGTKLEVLKLMKTLRNHGNDIAEIIKDLDAEGKNEIMDKEFSVDFKKIDVNMIVNYLSAQEIEAMKPFLGGF